jgi:hypothetical protein
VLISTDAIVQWSNPGADLIFGADERGLAGVSYERPFTEEDRAIGTMQTELAIAIAIARGHSAVIRVEDDGFGIAPEMLERIFEAFTQATPEPVASPASVLGLRSRARPFASSAAAFRR